MECYLSCFNLEQGSANEGPRCKPVCRLFLYIKFYWDIAPPVHFQVVYGYFCSTT